MLTECERVSRANRAGEMYGIAPDEAATREWYSRRGYDYRASGREVYKTL